MNREKQTPFPWVETSDTREMKNMDQAMDLMGQCAFGGNAQLLIHDKHLSEDFFNLKTRLAGEIFQKFANYNVRAALVLDKSRITGRFAELVLELNRGGLVKVFHSAEEARSWLHIGQ